MVTYYVDSAATGANDGTSWTDAWTSISSSTDAAAGDIILIDDGHSQTSAANWSVDYYNGVPTNPIRLLCVDKADDSLSTGAILGTTSGSFWFAFSSPGIIVHGVTLRFGNYFENQSSSSWHQRYDSCTFEQLRTAATGSVGFRLSGTSQDTLGVTEFQSCAFTFVTTSVSPSVFYLQFSAHQYITVADCTFTTTGSAFNALIKPTVSAVLTRTTIDVKDSDLTNLPRIVDRDNALEYVHARLQRCKLHATVDYWDSTFVHPFNEVQHIQVEGSAAGTISIPVLGNSYWESNQGTITSSLSRYRTGGADDGSQANAHSWEMATNANAKEAVLYLETPPITRWVSAGLSQTVTVYVASGGTLNDDDFWIGVSSPNETASPNTTARGASRSTSTTTPLSPAALTTDSGSTWNGTGVGTKQKITVTINPAVAGPVTVRCYLAKPSTTVYVDPRLEVA